MQIRKPRRRRHRASAQVIPNRTAMARHYTRRHIQPQPEIDHDLAWFVVRANIGAERRAVQNLAAEGFEIYWPIDDRWRIYRHRCSAVPAGWLGPYLFVGVRPPPRLDAIRAADGVASILGVGHAGPPLEVTGSLVQSVRDQVAGIEITAPAPFVTGQKVSLSAGPYAELAAIVQQSDSAAGTATVSLEMLGREHLIQVDFADLAVA